MLAAVSSLAGAVPKTTPFPCAMTVALLLETSHVQSGDRAPSGVQPVISAYGRGLLALLPRSRLPAAIWWSWRRVELLVPVYDRLCGPVSPG